MLVLLRVASADSQRQGAGWSVGVMSMQSFIAPGGLPLTGQMSALTGHLGVSVNGSGTMSVKVAH